MRANEPSFNTVDNPGNWSNCVCRAKFDKKGRCKFHSQSTGVIPASKNADGQRNVEDWYFFIKDGSQIQIRRLDTRNDQIMQMSLVNIRFQKKERVVSQQNSCASAALQKIELKNVMHCSSDN